MPRDPYQWGRSSSGPFGGKARSEVQSKWQSRSTDPVGGVLEPRSRALLYPQEAGCAQRVCPRLHPRCPLRPCRAVSTTRGRAQDSRNAAGLRAHQNASFPLLAPNAEGLCPEQQVALQASCPPLPSFPRCGQPSVFPAFTGTQPLSPRSLPRPRKLLSLLSPFPGTHAQPEPRAHIPALAGARVSCTETRDGHELHHQSPEPRFPNMSSHSPHRGL